MDGQDTFIASRAETLWGGTKAIPCPPTQSKVVLSWLESNVDVPLWVGWLEGWLVGWLVSWLVGWLTGYWSGKHLYKTKIHSLTVTSGGYMVLAASRARNETAGQTSNHELPMVLAAGQTSNQELPMVLAAGQTSNQQFVNLRAPHYRFRWSIWY